MTKIASLIVCAAALSCTLGCSTTVRSMTARTWILPPGTEGASTSAAAPAPASESEGSASPSEAAPPAAAPASGTGIASHFYLTYWEGDCKAILGCGRGDSHVKRCRVNADNSVECKEEGDATKALTPN